MAYIKICSILFKEKTLIIHNLLSLIWIETNNRLLLLPLKFTEKEIMFSLLISVAIMASILYNYNLTDNFNYLIKYGKMYCLLPE